MPADIESVRQGWAAWLVGTVMIYGVLQRLLLMLFCRWRWQTGQATCSLDLSLPGYGRLREP